MHCIYCYNILEKFITIIIFGVKSSPGIVLCNKFPVCLQEFQVAYVFIKMGNSPRPGVWALEKSNDYGQTWQPWKDFADSPADCRNFYDTEASDKPRSDDDVICTTDFSKIVPLESGEVRVV